MPILFFVMVAVVPFIFTFNLWDRNKVTFDDLSVLFIAIFIMFAWIFRQRHDGPVCIVSAWSFSSSPYLALAAGLSALSGALTANLTAALLLMIFSIAITIYSLIDGPAYGW